MSADPIHDHDGRADFLAALLASAHRQVGTAVIDRIAAQGGVPELRDPDLALARMLWSAHRATGAEVAERLNRDKAVVDGRRSRRSSQRMTDPGPLAGRLAWVRLKHRREALRLAHTYWPTDFTALIRDALTTLGELAELVEADELYAEDPWEEIIRITLLLERQLSGITLPTPRELARSDQLGTDYLTEVEQFLDSHVGPLQQDLDNAQRFLEGELVSRLDISEPDAESLLGADMVVQDLAEDLEQAQGKAQTLRLVVAAVERASSDFVGEDLSRANLDDIPLKGVRWDAGTTWPDEWEAWIRQASRPAGGEEGVLIVASEPHSSVVSADA
ncbi:hypothetical protein C0216_30635 (plasmid) [Streptomyces globosus]|uniref:Uncharacterized protein n=1 Tax=Streptomyces globosus TaxID=68209 RepID=A0A344UAF7_9ACTN|nr:hypothetical protein [Streptomyces globosus]AXE27878.1 hypothetical protein C0216_30635 [Streptomyces globosus]